MPTDWLDVTAQPLTIVPANRLGQLLAEARLRNGHDLAELADRSRGEFTVGELSDLEAGHRLLDDGLVASVTTLYELDCGPIVPQRAELTIDLDRSLVTAAGRVLPLDSTERDHIIDRYLSLVYVLRNRRPGTPVPLRHEDLAILAASLAERTELIEEQLLRVMETGGEPVNALVRWFKSRLWVPGAGALVGAVSVGTLVMVTADMPTTGVTMEDGDDTDPDRVPAPGLSSLPLVETAPSTSTPVAASATTPDNPINPDQRRPGGGAGMPDELGAAAEDLLPFDWRDALPGWQIVYRSANPDFRGLTYPYDQTIEMYVRRSDTPESLAGILAHEIGHAIDVTYLSDDDRARWANARGIDDAPWWPTAYASDFETGAGDFAESFAYWAVEDPNSSRLAGTPDQTQLGVIAELVASHL